MGEWWRAVKSRIDSGLLRTDVVTVTGSASLDLLKQREMFPRRRGRGRDVVLHPLDFGSYVQAVGGLALKREGLGGVWGAADANRVHGETLSGLFEAYLKTGGLPAAIEAMGVWEGERCRGFDDA